ERLKRHLHLAVDRPLTDDVVGLAVVSEVRVGAADNGERVVRVRRAQEDGQFGLQQRDGRVRHRRIEVRAAEGRVRVAWLDVRQDGDTPCPAVGTGAAHGREYAVRV